MAGESLVITIDRDRFRLETWREGNSGYTRTGKFRIAVGRKGTATPRGVYSVNGKSRTPDWKAPDSEWVAEEMRGRVYEFRDPRNPFAGGFISFGDEGVGIHGTKFDPEVGTRASHGCIRMVTSDFKKIYDSVEKGTVVVIL